MKENELVRYAVAGAFGALVTLLVVVCCFAVITERKPELITAWFGGVVGTQQAPDAVPAPTDQERVIAAVERADPAVVAITVSKDVPVYERYYDDRQISPYGLFFSVPQVRQRGTELQEVGGGSGFLVSSDGYIVTNRHVVSDEDAQYTVFTNAGTSYEATVVARDPLNDVAVLKIEGEGFEHLRFGDSDSLRSGQSVIAIGNALAEFRNTVSVGVISGLSRSIVASTPAGYAESLEELIQTDAAINEGNSGGPLLNLDGEVIGVNVAIVSGAQNVGFALSSNSIRSVIKSVQETGRIIRPYLGVRYVEITPELQQEEDLLVDHGAWVRPGTLQSQTAVLPNSPASKSGIQEGDIIISIDGERIDINTSLASVLRGKAVGDEVTLSVLRAGEAFTIRAVLEELPSL